MARLCAISMMGRQKLNEGFKKLYGKPLSAIVLDMRMEKARQLLIDTDESIERIATATGYQHRSSFTRAYKKYYGHNPGLERRKDL